MRIAIFGSGGVGGYFGARLAAAGSDVTFIARGAHLAAMKQHGLRIKSPRGDLTLENPQAVDDIRNAGPIDLALVAVKLWATDDAANALAPLAEQGTTVISFQNGVIKEDVFKKRLPAQSLMGGVSYISAVIESPGVILHKSPLQGLAFGEYDGSSSPRAEALLAACKAADIDAKITPDIERVI